MTRRPPSGKTRVDALSSGPRIDQQPTSGAGHAGPIERLVAFHADMRLATAALTTLIRTASRGSYDLDQAKRLAEFFGGPLLWHDEDEEVGLLPRLRRLTLSEADVAVIDATSRGHDRMEELLEHLGPVLASLADGVRGAPMELEAAAAEARALEVLLEGHMRLEEESLFPLATSRLSPEELDELEREMASRHGDANERPRRAVEL